MSFSEPLSPAPRSLCSNLIDCNCECCVKVNTSCVNMFKRLLVFTLIHSQLFFSVISLVYCKLCCLVRIAKYVCPFVPFHSFCLRFANYSGLYFVEKLHHSQFLSRVQLLYRYRSYAWICEVCGFRDCKFNTLGRRCCLRKLYGSDLPRCGLC